MGTCSECVKFKEKNMDMGYCLFRNMMIFGSDAPCWRYEHELPDLTHVIFLRVEFKDIGQALDEGVAEALLNILDEKCPENVGIKNGIQFHRIPPEMVKEDEKE